MSFSPFKPILVVTLAALCAGMPLSAQQDDPELAAIDAQLPGTLVNDPRRIDWDVFGDSMRVEGRQDDSIPGGGAARSYEITRAGSEIYDAGTNIPIRGRFASGEAVTVGFFARTISSDRPDNAGVVGVRFQRNAAPYPGFGDAVVEVGQAWDWYEVTATADRNYRDNLAVGLQLAGARQIIEIGQAFVITGAASILGVETDTTSRSPNAAAEAALPGELQGIGRLLNDPAERNWQLNTDIGTSEEREDATIWYGRSTRLEAPTAGANPWDLSAIVPLNQPVSAGDRILVAVAVRLDQSNAADGQGIIGMRLQQSTPPYAGFGDATATFGNGWQLASTTMVAETDLRVEEAQVSLHFAHQQQSVDVGPVFVFKIE